MFLAPLREIEEVLCTFYAMNIMNYEIFKIFESKSVP